VSVPIVHVVDDDEPFRTAVSRLLRAQGYGVRAHASAGDYLLAPADPDSACVVLDLQMPGPSGLDLQEAMLRFPLSLPIVFLTGEGDIAASVRAMKAGAVDFLTKPVEPADLLRAVEKALERHRAAGVERAGLAEALARHASLTPRERSVFEHVAAGEPNKAIARALGITERTVKMHRAQVMLKMQARSLADLVHVAGLLARAPAATPRS
jgi:FixJ family two-component response regulator